MRRLRDLLDSLDALGAIAAFVIVVLLLVSGRIPKDIELWGYALGGALLISGLTLFFWNRIRSFRQPPRDPSAGDDPGGAAPGS